MKPTNPTKEFKDLHFPKSGFDTSLGFSFQPNRPVENKEYARSCAIGTNVRGHELLTLRGRGGQRPGLRKYILTQVAGLVWIVQDLNTIVIIGDPVTQPSQSGRIVTLVAVAQGNIFFANPGDVGWTPAINNTGEDPPLNFVGVMQSTQCIQKLWFVDGTNYVVYNPHINQADAWVPTAGQMPQDEDGNLGRLICTWRGRVVISGLLLDPQNWFMSAVSDPTDWNYSGQDVDGTGIISTTPTQAIAGNNAPQGLIGDVVTALIPYSDDILIFGGDSSIYMMRGDPMEGGQIDRVSDAIGFAWGEAWCKDPAGNVYFLSNRCGVWMFNPTSGPPQRISQAIENDLLQIDTGTHGVRLIWDDRFQGFHMFVTPLELPGASTHWFWESRNNAWWKDTFANSDMDPLCCCTFDGNLPNDRVPLIGSWDGFVRAIDPLARDDDGVPISSAVIIGPLLTKDLDDVMLDDLQAILGETSGSVSFAVYIGTTAEEALSSAPVLTGAWGPGRNLSSYVRRAAHAIYVKITATNPWAMEAIRARIQLLGKVRQRGS